ncbi:MAG: SPOR domain-containing protein [Betaproteobacteria bacterium]|nr:SPOR domain-containing protein [Betaproteobacteria bacterium]
MGVFVGMILGAVIVTIAVAIFNQNDNPFSQTLSTKQAADTATATQQTPPSVAALPGKPGDRPAEKPDYTFFNTLPNGENAPITPLPPAELPQPQATIAPAQTTTPTKQIYLQLAAFENAEQADDLKARLLLMGLDPVTQRAQLPDGRIVHRIRIGPFTDREDLKAMRARLVSSGFSAEEVSN